MNESVFQPSCKETRIPITLKSNFQFLRITFFPHVFVRVTLYQNLNLHITGDVQYFATTTQEPFLIPGYEESCRMSRR